MSDIAPALLPDHHQQLNFFICDLTDISAKGDNASMEHPVFSLKPIHRSRHYEKKGKFLKVVPTEYGSATVHDRDVLIFCISQCMAALKDGQKITQTLRFIASDLLIATNRETNGRSYKRLHDALRRLTGTLIETNIKNGELTIDDGFHLLEKFRIVRENDAGRMLEVEVTLPLWILDAIHSKHILTLHPNYFRLRKPLERRLYELARKHVGDQKIMWPIYLSNLSEKVGSESTLKKFKHMVSQIIADDAEKNYFPEYGFCFKNPKEPDPIVTFYPKIERLEKQKRVSITNTKEIHLSAHTIEKSKKFVPTGTDIYAVKADWQEFIHKKKIKIENKEAIFIDFCKKWSRNRQPKLPLK